MQQCLQNCVYLKKGSGENLKKVDSNSGLRSFLEKHGVQLDGLPESHSNPVEQEISIEVVKQAIGGINRH